MKHYPQAEIHPSRLRESKLQKKRLLEWACERGLLPDKLPPEWELNSRKDAGGSEHHVFAHEAGRWVKITRGNGDWFGYVPKATDTGWEFVHATASEYLARLNAMNEMMPGSVELHGVFKDEFGGVKIISSQPHLHGQTADCATIENEMAEAKYKALGDDAFYRAGDNRAIFALHGENAVLVDEAGLLVFDGIPINPTGALKAMIERLAERVVIPERKKGFNKLRYLKDAAERREALDYTDLVRHLRDMIEVLPNPDIKEQLDRTERLHTKHFPPVPEREPAYVPTVEEMMGQARILREGRIKDLESSGHPIPLHLQRWWLRE